MPIKTSPNDIKAIKHQPHLSNNAEYNAKKGGSNTLFFLFLTVLVIAGVLLLIGIK